MNENTTNLEELNSQIVACRRCPRLVDWREQVALTRKRAYMDQEYWGRPVPGFGDGCARILIVGLAPGAHGSNRTGRMFTGDSSGEFLYASLHRAGFANQPTGRSADDGLRLNDVFISAACRCAPPDNKPTPLEIENCRPFLQAEIELLDHLQGFVALGRIAYDWLLSWYRTHAVPTAGLEFRHAAFYSTKPALPWLITSYHPSRQNTQTGRLTPAMFDQVWALAREHLADR